ncbi:MAG: DNA-binding transcriptional LysR family regulator [Phenylobacterium sp.]|jgi:DNA-binding transcriptional LysR family regulator
MCMKTQLERWDDIRVAFEVAQRGTLSAAAVALNVHHSTVLRRINALEARLNTRLFHRHARGYRPTEAGQALLQVAGGINEQVDKLTGYLQGTDQQISGALVITTVSGLVDIITPWLAEFQRLYPQLRLEILLDQRKLRLDYGEAHIALRPGKQPTEPDYIAQKLLNMEFGLYASKDYIRREGLPKDKADLVNHKFVSGMPDSAAPFSRWIEANIPNENIIFRTTDLHQAHQAVLMGIGMGVNTYKVGDSDPNLVKVLDDWDEWHSDLWLVTHLLMHRTSRVQAFCDFIKQKFKEDY